MINTSTPMATRAVGDRTAIEAALRRTWQGYRRADGSMGIRNKVLVMYTVECARFVADEVTRRIGDNEVETVGFTGCTDNDYATRLLVSMIQHPNVGAVVVIGLGCEYVQPERLAEVAEEIGKPAAWFRIQDLGGTRSSIDHGVGLVRDFQQQLTAVPQQPMGWSDLVIGSECGGSDYTSGLAGNPVVGGAFDELGDAGGVAIFEEIVEAIGLRDVLVGRAADEQAARDLGQTYDKALDYCRAVRQYSVSPGNFAGGLSTIEEKSMGAIAKSGSRPIRGVLKVGMRAPAGGLWLLDSTPDPHFMQFGITNPNDSEGLIDLISCGAQLLLFVTGRGSVVGSPIAPTIKITGNPETYRRMQEDMDLNAGTVLTGEQTPAEAVAALLNRIADTCSGELTCSEAFGHKEYIVPYKYQLPTVEFRRTCDS